MAAPVLPFDDDKTEHTGQQETSSVLFYWNAVHAGHVLKVDGKTANTSFDIVLETCLFFGSNPRLEKTCSSCLL